MYVFIRCLLFLYSNLTIIFPQIKQIYALHINDLELIYNSFRWCAILKDDIDT